LEDVGQQVILWYKAARLQGRNFRIDILRR
jgi:hypothetical protein